MNGSMMMVLSLCGTWFVCGIGLPEGNWVKVLKSFLGGICIYLFLFIAQAILYEEVVLKWLAF